MGCTSEGARRAANSIYRGQIAAADAAGDLDLANGPLAKVGAAVGFNAGLQPNDGSTVVISLLVSNVATMVDLVLVLWGKKKGQTALVPLGTRELAQATPIAGSIINGANFYITEFVEPCNSPAFEVRVRGLAGGTIVEMRAWTY